MALKKKEWIAVVGVTVLLIIGAKYLSYFPGDVVVARFVQGIAPKSPGWAQWISSTAEFPWNLVLVAAAAGFSWWIGRRRAALLALVGFAGMWVLGVCLKPLVARPRPSPDLIYAVREFSGYSFPSTFALVYASTIGFIGVLFLAKASGMLRTTVIFSCGLLLLVGGAARIALGAHWPSDVILSYLIGFLWVFFLLRFLHR